MEEVPEATLPIWLARARGAGWSLVGLEQTAESTSLPDFQWPQRTVLVLGRCGWGALQVLLPDVYNGQSAGLM